MEFYTLASGSSGNSTLISSGGASLLVDAGISCRKLTSRLALLGKSPSQLDGILITHTHSDHICGLKVLLKNRDIPVYASEITGAELLGRVETLDPGQLRILHPEEPVEICGISVLPFGVSLFCRGTPVCHRHRPWPCAAPDCRDHGRRGRRCH